MFIQQLYTNCLAEAAYYIESNGEAIIIDPIRETDQYLKLLQERGAKLKYILETHFHADFVSGHIDLARKTGADIVFGPGANTAYKVYLAKDQEIFSIGALTVKVLHTPGHTPESTCYLLQDENGKPHAIFTGDTLFVGDVGRPDLLDGVMSKEDLAGKLYDSLQILKQLPDEVLLYPAHGPGSACGKNIGKETWSSMGTQKKTNYALLANNRDRFINDLTSGLSAPPAYFFHDAKVNKQGYNSLEDVMKRSKNPLTVNDFKVQAKEGSLILDCRTPDEFEKGHIKGSLNIGLNGQFAIWAATLIKVTESLIIVAEENKEDEAITRLARVGYENVKGFLKGGIAEWINTGNSLETIHSVSPEEFAAGHSPKSLLLDVRKPGEYENGHLKGAIAASLASIDKQTEGLDKSAPYFVYCAGGYRSMIACSILKNKGFTNLTNIYKGFGGLQNAGLEIEKPQEAAV